jgi:5-methylcytosine-specific restriction enzyme B
VIEADKRGLPLMLPQSKRNFSVPPNVYIVGTMNTADRSIRVLDAAIRRRFAFSELMPDSGLLAGGRVRDLPLDDFLDSLNAAISRREGREKQIGHSVLMDGDGPIDTVEEFAKRFRYEIVPLLQEYCYEDYRALMDYIGPDLVDVENQRLKEDVFQDPEALVAALAARLNRMGAN